MVSDKYKLMSADIIRPNQFYSIDRFIDEAIEEYLQNNDLEMMNEGVKDWVRSGIIGSTMLASTVGGLNVAQAAPSDKPAMQASANNVQDKRREVVQLQSDNSNFKKVWSQPDAEGKVSFTKKKENECINTVLSLKTVEQHDQFLDVIKHHMDEIMRVQSYKTSSKYDKQRIIKSYDYQLLSYYYKLTIASKYAMEMSK